MMVTASLVLPCVVVVPIIAAAAALAVGPKLSPLVAAVALAAVSVVVGIVTDGVLDEGLLRHTLGGWEAPLGIALEVGGMGALLLVTNTAVMVIVSLYAVSYLPRQHDASADATRLFWPLWLLLLAGLNGLSVSADLFNLYVCLEVTGLSAAALVALSGKHALVPGLRYVLVSLVGSTLYLLAVALLYGEYGVVDLAIIRDEARSTTGTLVGLGLITGGLLLKSAILPLHFWLPPAHGGALSPISAVLSALVVKASFFLLVRLWERVFHDVVKMAALELLGVLGVVAIVWGSVEAMRQRRLKMLVAYSTVAQLGYLMLAFPLGAHAVTRALAWEGAMLFLVGHAVAKAAAFLAAGNFQYALRGDDLHRLPGGAQHLPVTTVSFALAGVALVGLPPSGTFMAKWMLLRAAITAGRFDLAVVILVGSLLAAGYVFPVLRRALCQPKDESRWCDAARPSWLMESSTLVLALIAALLGFFIALPSALLRMDLTRVFLAGQAL